MSSFPIPVPSPVVTNWPDGSSLSSTALSAGVASQVMQALTALALGITGAPNQQEQVRVAWQVQGQPFQDVTTDICYVFLTERGGDYDRMRSEVRGKQSGTTIPLVQYYTRIWECRWMFYGPNSFDHARLVRSSIFTDYFRWQLQPFSLYAVAPFDAPARIPEVVNGQWFDRSDMRGLLYEQVAETRSVNSVASVPVVVNDSGGNLAEFEVS